MNILIVGASGNLGSHLARHLIKGPHQLRLLVHKTTLPLDIANALNASQVQADLNVPSSLHEACKNIHCIVYVAGVLFRPRPETFLYRTNTTYVQNVVDAALSVGVRKFLLISFPHVEGETTPCAQAKGRLDVHPSSIHSRTRLAAEKYLFRACNEKTMKPLVFRAGVIYGRGVKLTEAARNLITPLTRDIVAMGMTSVVADTTRMKNEIVSDLMFPTLRDGLTII